VAVDSEGECAPTAPACPEGVPVVECLLDPCAAFKCQMDMVPVANYCGECSCTCVPKPDDLVCPQIYLPVCGEGEAMPAATLPGL
jgi:hypothetical protein